MDEVYWVWSELYCCMKKARPDWNAVPLKSSGEHFNLLVDLSCVLFASLSTRRNDDSRRAELWLSVQIYLKQVSNCLGKPDHVWNSPWSFEGANCKSAYTSSNWNLTSRIRSLSNKCQISHTQYFKTLIKQHTKWSWFFLTTDAECRAFHIKNAVITLTHWVHTHAWSCPIEQLYCWSLELKALLKGPSVVVMREEQVFHSLSLSLSTFASPRIQLATLV